MIARRNDSTTDLAAEAERAVAVYEALALGEPYADLDEAARLALLDFKDPALMALFPRYVKATADMVAVFEFRQEAWSREKYPVLCAELHSDSYDVEPAFAAFLRSGAIVDRVASAGAAFAASVARDASQVADEFVERYRELIAQQLGLDGAEEPHASTIGTRAPALKGRIDACRTRHDEHKASEVARIEREQAEAAEAIASAERSRRAVVAEFFAARSGHRFLLRDRMFSGVGLSQSAANGAALFDLDAGDVVRRPTLEDLELAMRRAQAAEAVTA